MLIILEHRTLVLVLVLCKGTPSVFVKFNAPLGKFLFGSYMSQYIDKKIELVELNNILQAVSSYVAWLSFYRKFKFKLFQINDLYF